MKPYIHDPARFRAHFTGNGGLPIFQGAYRQRGHGRVLRKMKRYMVPLLAAGARVAKPYATKAAQKAAERAASLVFKDNPAMQQAIGNAAGKLAESVINNKVEKARKQRGGARRKPAAKGTTRYNAFDHGFH